ncbi:MAG: c-type cytochrome [Acidobacteriota bacterium]
MMTWRREIILGVLILIYSAVSLIAYTNYPSGDDRPRLTNLEWRGLELWRSHNCQACHQIYGFGGFLGPDLTNLDQDDQKALLAYLRAINRTGQSQPPPLNGRRAVSSWKHYGLILEEWRGQGGTSIPEAVRRGYEVWAQNHCGACHVPFTHGRHRAPDLSLHAINRSMPALMALLKSGRNFMPTYDLDHRQAANLSAFLTWVTLHRSDLVALNDQMLQRQPFSWTTVPWFEYDQ